MITSILVGASAVGCAAVLYHFWASNPTFASRLHDRRYRRKHQKAYRYQQEAALRASLLEKEIQRFEEFTKVHQVHQNIFILSAMLTVLWILAAVGEAVNMWPAVEQWVGYSYGEGVWTVLGALLGVIGLAAVSGAFIAEGTMFGISRGSDIDEGNRTNKFGFVLLGSTILFGLAMYMGYVNLLRIDALGILSSEMSFSGKEEAAAGLGQMGVERNIGFLVAATMTAGCTLASIGLGYFLLGVFTYWNRSKLMRSERHMRRLRVKAALTADTATSMLPEVNRLREQSGRARFFPEAQNTDQVAERTENARDIQTDSSMQSGAGTEQISGESAPARGWGEEDFDILFEENLDNGQDTKTAEANVQETGDGGQSEGNTEEDLNEDLSQVIRKRSS